MRIIHCSDLHLDSKMLSNFTPEQAKNRRLELLKTFERMVCFANENEVSIIIIAGDLFDKSDYVYKKIKDRVISIIKNNPQIDFIYLKGNHDKTNYFEKVEQQLENFKLFDKSLKTFEYDNVHISGVEYSLNIRKEYENMNFNSDKFNIVVLHGQESNSFNDFEENVNINMLKNKNIDYLALGHIHSFKISQLDERGFYCYSGCLDGRGFDECGEKGFVLLQIEKDNTFKYKFIPISSRLYYDIDVDITAQNSEDEIYDTVLKSVEKISENDIVRVNLIGEIDENLSIDLEYFQSKFADMFYLIKFNDKTNTKIDYLSYQNDISLKGEFIRLIQSSDMEENQKNDIIKVGIKALLGKEF